MNTLGMMLASPTTPGRWFSEYEYARLWGEIDGFVCRTHRDAYAMEKVDSIAKPLPPHTLPKDRGEPIRDALRTLRAAPMIFLRSYQDMANAEEFNHRASAVRGALVGIDPAEYAEELLQLARSEHWPPLRTRLPKSGFFSRTTSGSQWPIFGRPTDSAQDQTPLVREDGKWQVPWFDGGGDPRYAASGYKDYEPSTADLAALLERRTEPIRIDYTRHF